MTKREQLEKALASVRESFLTKATIKVFKRSQKKITIASMLNFYAKKKKILKSFLKSILLKICK